MQTDKNIDTTLNEDEVSLVDVIAQLRGWISYLFSKWIILVFISLSGAFLGLAYAYIKKPIYTAKLSFALEDEKSSGSLGGYAALAGQFGIDLGGGGGGAFAGDNLLELMKSRSMVESALLKEIEVNGHEETLAELYIDFNNYRDKWKNDPSIGNIHFLAMVNRKDFNLKQDSLLGEFHKEIVKKCLNVNKVDKKLSIISLQVDSKNEVFSKSFAEALVKNVSDFYINTKIKRSAQNVAILQHQTDSVRKQLNAAISGVALAVDANPNLNPSRQILNAPSQKRQVDVTANRAILEELVKNLEVSRVSLRRETPLIQIIDAPIYPLEKTEAGKIYSVIMGALISFIVTAFYLILTKKDI